MILQTREDLHEFAKVVKISMTFCKVVKIFMSLQNHGKIISVEPLHETADSLRENISLNNYEFKITDNTNDLVIFYKGMLPDLFREEQGIVVEGLIDKNNNIVASKVYAKHDENYMPASIKKELEKNNQWKKDYK